MTTHPRITALATVFDEIGRTRMQGVPILNPVIQVETIGFAPLPIQNEDEDTPHWLGVLLTPWFMNLVRLPLAYEASPPVSKTHQLGDLHFDFLGQHEPSLGGFSFSSLFSPVLEFANQSTAIAAAHEVLRLIRTPSATSPVQPASTKTAPIVRQGLMEPSRRGFLFGRSSQ